MKEKTPLSDLLPAESCPCSGMRGTMAFCKNCGTELKEGAVFCKNCGFKVGDKLAVQGAAGGPAPGASGTFFGISGGDYQRILKEKMRDKRFRMGVGAGQSFFLR